MHGCLCDAMCQLPPNIQDATSVTAAQDARSVISAYTCVYATSHEHENVRTYKVVKLDFHLYPILLSATKTSNDLTKQSHFQYYVGIFPFLSSNISRKNHYAMQLQDFTFSSGKSAHVGGEGCTCGGEGCACGEGCTCGGVHIGGRGARVGRGAHVGGRGAHVV